MIENNVERLQQILDLKLNGMSQRAIGRELNISESTVRHYLSKEKSPKPKKTDISVYQTVEEIYKKYQDIVKAPKFTKPHTPKTQGLTVVAGDFHAPMHNIDAVMAMIKRTKGIAERLIIAGDLAEMFNFSRYVKFDRPFSPLEEVTQTHALLQLLASSYPEVVIMRGNHDDRFIKYLLSHGIDSEVLDVFKYLYGEQAVHPVLFMANQFPNVTIAPLLTYEDSKYSHFYQQGDAIISHAEKFSASVNGVVSQVIQSLSSYLLPAGIVKPFKVVIQAHTHMAGRTFNPFGVVGIENGCMCRQPSYMANPRMLPGRLSTLGYTELWQDSKGVSDIERTNFIPLVGI